MDEHWEGMTMEQECESIMRSISQSSGKSKSKPSPGGGRLWTSCISCQRVAVLTRLGWLVKRQADILRDQNGFVWTVCGKCERQDGRTFREGQVGGIKIHREATEATKAYRAIANHCTSLGWDPLSVKSERLLDRRALLQAEVSGTTLRSVQVTCEEEGWAVKILDFVETALL